MTSTEKQLLKILGLGLMYLFAAPALLVKWILHLRKDLRAIARIRTGFLECPYCHVQNPLNRMATCAKCRATEPSSVLRCSFCKTTFKTITCDQCSATLRVV
ncbi:MAG TPA: hypothetical protein VNI54_04885 [Thermoanaerobaculia bacterium]|nr:hypothetical protein [Thermoanaerobaculia bacterium]